MKRINILKPITATPYKQDASYLEMEPCEALKPYIRCFWGTSRPIQQKEAVGNRLVIPDACMDIILDINYSQNCIQSRFCGINDGSFQTGRAKQTEDKVSTFAIRFYSWSVYLFAEDTLRDSKNIYCDAGRYFSKLKKLLEQRCFDLHTLEERKNLAEYFLLENACLKRRERLVTDAVIEILRQRGSGKVEGLAKDLHISGRQLERLFKENIGVSPKLLSCLARYQFLWRDIAARQDFNILDAVERYGYTDQSHLIHDFKRFHTMGIKEARELAWKDVANLQENSRLKM